MPYKQIVGGGLWVPNQCVGTAIPPAYLNSSAFVATGDKHAWVGRVYFRERAGTKNIQFVGLRFGAVTKAGGSALTVSLQDVSLTAGPPMQPDGTQDQTVAVPNSAIAANAWLQTGNFNAVRPVSYGELLAVVTEYDGAGRLGADSFVLVGITQAGAARLHGQGCNIVSGVPTAHACLPNVLLGFADGTFGTLYGGYPSSALGTHGYANATPVADEYAIGIQFPFPTKICGVQLPLAPNAGADCSVILYAGTTPLQAVSVDANAVAAVGGPRFCYVPFPETALAADTLYYVAVRPDTANGIGIYYADVASANHLQAHEGGTAFIEYFRVDGGAWNAVPTRRPFISVELSAFDDGAGVAGGGAALSRVRTGY